MIKALVVAATASACLAIGTSVSAGERFTAAKECGNVYFAHDLSAGDVVAYKTRCSQARAIVRRCGKFGRTPPGWDARYVGDRFNGVFRVGKEDTPRWAKGYVKGDSPPKLAKCVRG
jgi:hypothetical protein